MLKRFFGLKQIDVLLVLAAIAVLIVVIDNRIVKKNHKPKRIDITVSLQCENIIGKDVLNALAAEFGEQNPELRILIAADTEPASADIIFFDDGEFPGLVNSKTLASLAPYIHTEAQTGQWALPLVSFMDLFFYNIDILETAHCDRPPKTRAELLAAARAVAALETAFPLALALDPSDPLALRRDIYPWIWQAGGELRTESGELSRTAVETIAFFGQMHREGLLAPESFGKTGAQRLEEFAGGKIAMLAASSRDIPLLRQIESNALNGVLNGINFGITAMPALAPGKNRMGLSGIYAGISSGCALPDEAWTFLAFIAGKSQVIAQALGAVPGSFPSAFPGTYIAKDPLYSKAWDIFEAADIVEYQSADPSQEETDRIIREGLVMAFQETSGLPAAR